MRKLVILLAAAGLALAACSGDDVGSATAPDDGASTTSSAAPVDPLEVATDLGPVRGTDADVEGVRAFLTIPYAAPPTGEQRWRAPQPHEPWSQPRDATEPGASCPQSSEGVTAQFTVIPASDEDCLTLSVWSPTDAADLPVMVWIHGGGFTTGSAHQPYYIGDHLAARGVVVVDVNYRLGALGFLATEGMATESDDGSYGNFGIADQTAALEWVQRNATAFGGDPGNVTIFGESAGGFSVCALLASPPAAGLYERAIIESGGGCNEVQPGDEAQAAGARFLDELGCDDLACARDVPVAKLLDTSFSPSLVADGVRLSATARDLATRGEVTVPVITGSNADEAKLFTLGAPEPTDAELADQVRAFTDDPAALLALYPAGDYDTNLARYQAVFTDAAFACPSLDFASVVPDSYAYHFTYVTAQNPFDLGATHGAELAFVFGHPEGIRGIDTTPDATSTAVGDAMQQAWTSFATDGDPGSGWPRYADGGQIMEFGATPEVVDEIRGGRCDAVVPLLR